ncbi:MAG: rhodanese-like domain-containing protein [Pararhodobacter sp.]|nr:rhodanese-like domain-containing protein [Pararhodobacter sp.]
MRLVIALIALLIPLPLAAQQIFTAAPPAEELARAPVLLVDIRQPQEWVQTGVLPNALLITFDDPASFLQALAPHLEPGRPVALICRSGNRTSRAASLIAGALPVPVIDIQGGMLRLLSQGYSPAPPTREAGCTIC